MKKKLDVLVRVALELYNHSMNYRLTTTFELILLK